MTPNPPAEFSCHCSIDTNSRYFQQWLEIISTNFKKKKKTKTREPRMRFLNNLKACLQFSCLGRNPIVDSFTDLQDGTSAMLLFVLCFGV